MEVSEERELKRVVAEYEKGLGLLRKHQYTEALPVFENILTECKDSAYYSVVEIENRSRVYKKVCEAQLNPVVIELKTPEDFLYNGVYQLNSGNPDLALERFKHLQEINFADPYLDYLFSLGYLKKGEKENCLSYLKSAIEKDGAYKIIAHNEPDFDPVFEDQDFVTLFEM